MKNILLLSIGFLLVMSSCRPDEIIPEVPEVTVYTDVLLDYIPTVVPITGSVDGFVTNENGDPVQGAQVKLGNETTVTNIDGHFNFLNVDMNKEGTIIQVTETGYFDGSRRFLPSGNAVDRVQIQLLQKLFDQSVDGATGGNVSIGSSAGTIAFPSNSIVDANGDVFTGNVDVAVKYLDPTAEITSAQMPGSLFGVTEALEERILATYGMIAVELIDDNGNPLNLGENTPVTITMPVPASILSRAPATIPLWSYNEAFGVWTEEGEATLTNGSYIGEVTHFSWWNWDYPLESVDLTTALTDQNGNQLNNYLVNLTSATIGTGWSYTNSAGEITGQIPAGEVLLLEVHYPNNCGGLLHSQSVGPFTNSTNSVNITVNLPPSLTTTITGDAVCSGAPINDWALRFESGGIVEYRYGTGSSFSMNKTFCNPGIPYSLKLINPLTSQESILLSGTSGTTNNLGTVDACQNTLPEFLSLNVDGHNHVFLAIYDSTAVNSTTIDAYDQSNGTYYITLNFAGSTVGSYPGAQNSVSLYFTTPTGFIQGSGQLTAFNVTTYNTTDIIGTFSGQILDTNSGNMVPISGSFDNDL